MGRCRSILVVAMLAGAMASACATSQVGVGSDASTFVSSPPAPGLAPFVEQYVGYRVQGTPSGLHRGLPSRHMTFIVSIGPTIDVVRQTDPAQHPARYRAVLSGLQASPALIEQHGDEEGVAIELTPLGSRALFGMPTAAVWNTTLELAEVAGPAGDALWERLQGPALLAGLRVASQP